MARNYTASDAYKIMKEGIDFDSISDIMRRYPNFAYNALKSPDKLIENIPGFISARKVEGMLRGNIEINEDENEKEIETDPFAINPDLEAEDEEIENVVDVPTKVKKDLVGLKKKSKIDTCDVKPTDIEYLKEEKPKTKKAKTIIAEANDDFEDDFFEDVKPKVKKKKVEDDEDDDIFVEKVKSPKEVKAKKKKTVELDDDEFTF